MSADIKSAGFLPGSDSTKRMLSNIMRYLTVYARMQIKRIFKKGPRFIEHAHNPVFLFREKWYSSLFFMDLAGKLTLYDEKWTSMGGALCLESRSLLIPGILAG